MKKRITSILLTLVMLIGMTPFSAFAAGGATGEYLDAEGDERNIPAATAITSGTTSLTAGWYTVSGVFEINSRINASGGAVHIVLMDGADLTVHGGIGLSGENTSLTIYAQSAGTGKLTVKDVPDYCAGIGSDRRGSCGNIAVNGGTVTANGGRDGAGIGGGQFGQCGDIAIAGGIITASGNGGAGVGGGAIGGCRRISITGGTVIASSDFDGVGIGSCHGGTCDGISITGGIIKATKGPLAAQHIGSGDEDTVVDVDVPEDLFDSGEEGRCRCISCSYFDAVPYIDSPDGTKAYSLKEYYQNKLDGLYYSDIPFTLSNRIGDETGLIGWLSEGGGGNDILHVFGEWVTIVEATCTTDGKRMRKCKDCDFTREEVIPAKGHDFGSWVTKMEATSSSAEMQERECTACHTIEKKFFSIPYCYHERSDAKSFTSVKGVVQSAETITPDSRLLETGWYVVSGTVEIGDRLSLSGNVSIILMDGADLTVRGGIGLNDADASLSIYAQSTGSNMGKLTVTDAPQGCAGIGSNKNGTCGEIHIHGGNLDVAGGYRGAGIGSGYGGVTDCIRIFDGVVKADGGEYSAGIGTGYHGQFKEDYVTIGVIIYGGAVTATGGLGGAGIGTGSEADCPTIRIYGGTVKATGGKFGAGIGSGLLGTFNNFDDKYIVGESIIIDGGIITATGGAFGAGIGTGNIGTIKQILISNGVITATGGSSAAGIGLGNDGSSNYEREHPIYIEGGYIKAKGGEGAEHIGKALTSAYVPVSIFRCHSLEKYGAMYINYEPITDPDPHCVNPGYETYFKDLRGGKYYSAIPFTQETLIGDENDLAEWKSEGKPGYIAPIGHKDDDGDGICERCSFQLFEIIAAVQPTCTEAGHDAYTANYLDGLYYTDSTFTRETLIGDDAALAEWQSEDHPGYIAPLGHTDAVQDNICDRCCGYFHYNFDYDAVNATLQQTEDFHAATGINSSANTVDLTDGWYAVKGNVEVGGSLTVNGDVHLILADGSALTVKKGVILTEGNSLTIYVQSFGSAMGRISATGNLVGGQIYSAGIGGYSGADRKYASGKLTINGGSITATGGLFSAGIGGSSTTNCGEVTINAGVITAIGGSDAAGIGGGENGSLTKLTINGDAVVTARGNGYGAGIGGGVNGNGGEVKINSGVAMVYGGEKAAAFGKDSQVRLGTKMAAYEIVDRPTSYDPSITKEVIGDKLSVNDDGTVAVGTCKKAIVEMEFQNDGPDGPMIPFEPDHEHLGYIQRGVAPTSGTSGYKDFYICSCGKFFEDQFSKTEITDLNAWVSVGGRGYLAPLGYGGISSYTVTIPASGDSSIKVSATVSGSTATVKDISASEIAKAGTAAVSMDFSGLNKKVDEVKLPATTMKAISESASSGLEIRLSTGTVKFDADAVDAISATAGGKDITLNVETVNAKTLSAAQKSAVEGLGNAVIIKATLTSGGKTISDFGDGSAKVTVPYEMKNIEKVAEVYYLANSGMLTKMNATYDAATKSVTFTAPHFSEYVLTEAEALPFADVDENAFYADAVRWAAANGITEGTSATTFSPSATVTRGQVVTFLWRAAGQPEPVNLSSFSDVSADAYYAKAVAWAVENGITDGIGGGKFAPSKTCTRAEIVTFLWRYAGAPVVNYAMSFEDVPSGQYYTEAVRWAVAMGITQGTSATTFTPSNTCTRAETVTFLYRFSAVMSAAAAVAAGDMESAVVQVGSDGTGVLITRNDSDTDGVYRAAIIVPVVVTSYADSNGSGPNIQIRGGSRIIQQGALANINPSDVKSMDILKDASATAIYGSRGANAASGLGALQTQTPGVQIISTGGQPGAGATILNDTAAMSMQGRNLFVGITQANGQSEADVETVGWIQTPIGTPPTTMTEIQDAASASIYGSRAAN